MNNSIEKMESGVNTNTMRAARLAIVLAAALAWAGIAGAQSAPQHQHANPSQTGSAASAPATKPPADQAAARAAAEAAAAKLKVPTDAGDFYIVSSISMSAKQIVLKLPTEVTLLVQTNAQSQFLDETAKPLTLKDLRAGDTVFVVLQKSSGGTPVVQKLQRGGMTVQELHKKYMSGS